MDPQSEQLDSLDGGTGSNQVPGTESVPRRQIPPSARPWLVAAIVGLVLLVIAIVLLNRPATSSAPTPTPSATAQLPDKLGPTLVKPADLKAALAGVGHPVFWRGPRAGQQIVLTIKGDNAVSLAYVPEGTPVDQPVLLRTEIVSYPMVDAMANVQRIGSLAGGAMQKGPRQQVCATTEATPRNAYMAQGILPTEVEIFDGRDGAAWKMICDGSVITAN